ncbi:Mycophenolic acid acyl-glucuronide esterase, mitochondrial [Nymphon striatum]|nr:Mycophenolic acid acyl-glucuronide esterase, mitochondrial [Nymphon striatum]
MKPLFVDVNGDKIAHHHFKGSNTNIGLMWLGGYRSDMEGTKAIELEAYGRENNISCTRHDYSGHGESSGDFTNGTISAWLTQSLAVLDKVTSTPQILVGSSMGAWIALRMIEELKKQDKADRVAGLLLLAPAPDFTVELMEPELTDSQKHDLETQGYYEEPTPYGPDPNVFTKAFFDDGRKNRTMSGSINTTCPVHIIQGKQDPDVPWQHAQRLYELLRLAELRFSSLSAAFVASIVGFGGTVALVLAAAQAVNATSGQTASWVTMLCFGIAAESLYLSWRHKMPIVTAWSSPSLALIGTSTGFDINAAVGAFILTGFLFVLTGLLRPVSNFVERIPAGVSAGMLAGCDFAIFGMASQNLPGLAVIRASGYNPPVGSPITVTGIGSIITAFFGASSTCLAAITAAICTGEESHPDPAKRWQPALIMLITGLALLGPLANAITITLAKEDERIAGITTLIITASSIAFYGVGAPFWGLVCGLLVYYSMRLKR